MSTLLSEGGSESAPACPTAIKSFSCCSCSLHSQGGFLSAVACGPWINNEVWEVTHWWKRSQLWPNRAGAYLETWSFKDYWAAESVFWAKTLNGLEQARTELLFLKSQSSLLFPVPALLSTEFQWSTVIKTWDNVCVMLTGNTSQWLSGLILHKPKPILGTGFAAGSS